MPLMSTAAENASLDNDYGATKGPNAAAAHQVALFIGDPMEDGVEMPDTTEVDDGMGGTVFVPNGYARVVITNNGTNWAAAAEGQKTSAIAVQFPDALEAYAGTATHFALYDDADGTTGWDCAKLLDSLDITVAGDGPSVLLTIFYQPDPLEETP